MASKSDKSTCSEFALDGVLGGSWGRTKKKMLNKSSGRLTPVAQHHAGLSTRISYTQHDVPKRRNDVFTQKHTSQTAAVVEKVLRLLQRKVGGVRQRLHHTGSSGSSTSQVLLPFSRRCCTSITETPTA